MLAQTSWARPISASLAVSSRTIAPAGRRPGSVGFDGHALGPRISGAKYVIATTDAGPPFDDAARLGAHRRKPLDQATRDLAMKPGQRVVATQAAERGASRHAIDATRLAGFARRHGAAVY